MQGTRRVPISGHLLAAALNGAVAAEVCGDAAVVESGGGVRGSVAGEFSDRFLGAGVVDQVLAIGRGSDEG